MRQLKRYGPIAAIAVIAVIAIVVIAGGGDDDSDDVAVVTDTSGATASTTGPEESTTDTGGEITESPYPDGAMDFETAEALGLDADFGERCDVETGRVKTPAFFRPNCWLPFEGDNGGATAPGLPRIRSRSSGGCPRTTTRS